MAFTDDEIETVGSLTSFLGVIQNFGNDVTDRLRQSLQSKVKGFTSKQLEQSIRFDVTPVGKAQYRFVVYFDEYGSYLDQGVRGVGAAGLKNKNNRRSWRNQVTSSPFSFKAHRKPSAKHYRTWASVHGINMYAVRESVFRKGLKPNHWFSDVVNEDIANDLIKSMETIGVKRIELDIKNILEGRGDGK
jgi:hypothetical protein